MNRTEARALTRARGRDQEGGALVFVLIVTAALLFVAALGLQSSLSNRRGSVQALHAKNAFFCAETGLERARLVFSTKSQADLNTVLGGGDSTPYQTITGLSPAGKGLSGSCVMGNITYVWIAQVRDNVDDGPPSNPANDVDQVFIVDSEARLGAVNGPPMAKIAAVLTLPAASTTFRDYKTQDRLGAFKTGQ